MRFLIAGLLLLKSGFASAIAIDVPGYDFAALAGSLTTTAVLQDNLMDPVTAMTDDKATTYAFSRDNPASMDLTFSDGIVDGVNIANGAGVDMSIFFIGGGGHSVGLTLLDDSNILGTALFNTIAYTGFCIDDGSGACEPGSPTDLPIFVMNIDFSVYDALIDTVDTARLVISGASAVPSLVGAYYLEDSLTPVPVPAAVWPFTSGLGLMGLLARRRNA